MSPTFAWGHPPTPHPLVKIKTTSIQCCSSGLAHAGGRNSQHAQIVHQDWDAVNPIHGLPSTAMGAALVDISALEPHSQWSPPGLVLHNVPILYKRKEDL